MTDTTISPWEVPFDGVDSVTYLKFLAYHKKNPQIWKAFESITQELIQEGFVHFSADAICHQIRWRYRLEKNADDYKVNNNWASYYARAFERKYPRYKGFFELRETKGVTSKEAA